MYYNLLAVLSISLTVGYVAGLRCYECQGGKVDSSDSNVEALLKSFLSDEDCAEANIAKMTPKTCDPAPSGMEAKCSLVSSVVEADKGGLSFSMTYNVRMCAMVALGTKDECTAVDGSSFASSLADADVTAHNCYCSGDNCNGQSALAPVFVTGLAAVLLALYTKYFV